MLIPSVSIAATEAQTTAAIAKALARLQSLQQPEGAWRAGASQQGATGAAVFSLLSQRDKWGDNASLYQSAVEKGIAYLLSSANTLPVQSRNDGVGVCPGGASTCTGVYWFDNGTSTHGTGLVAPALAIYALQTDPRAIAASSGPVAGFTWAQIGQAIANALAASQSTQASGNRAGGWGRSIPGTGEADSSSTQSAVVSLIYAESLGAVTPQRVKDDLRNWLAKVQNPTGAVCQQPGVEPCNQAETGGWLTAMRFVGITSDDAALQGALRYLNSAWLQTPNESGTGNFGDPYAMLSVYRGLAATIGVHESARITNVRPGCMAADSKAANAAPSSRPGCSWSEDYRDWLVTNQKPDGSWQTSGLWPEVLSLTAYTDILGETTAPFPASDPKESSSAGSSDKTVAKAAAQTQPTALIVAPAADLSFLTKKKVRVKVRGGVKALAVDSDGDGLATATSDNVIRIFSAATGQQRIQIKSSLDDSMSLAFAGNTLSSGGKNSFVRIWNAVNGAEIAKFSGHEHGVRTIAANAAGTMLATSGEDTRILLWNLATRKLSGALFGPTHFVNALSFSPDGRFLASADEDARVLIFDVTTGKQVHNLRGHSGPLDSLAFSPNGAFLASGGEDSEVRLWDPVAGRQLRVLRGHSGDIRTIAFSPDSQIIATAGDDTQIRLWNTATGVLTKVLQGTAGPVNALSFDPKGRFLVAAGEDGQITLWNVTAGVRTRTIPVR